MARKTSELAEIACIKLRAAKDEIIATGDRETISWALDQFRLAEALLRRITGDDDIPAADFASDSEAA